MRWPASLVVLLLLAVLSSAACLEDQLAETEDLVVTPPWDVPESLEYALLDRDNGEEVGRGSLDIKGGVDTYDLSQNFSDDGDFDNSTITVHSDTLKPISGHRNRLVDDERKEIRSEYDTNENVVTITEILEDGEERPVPHELKENYYDNDSSLFLWRSIAFSEGYQATYRTVVTGSGEQHVVQIEVVGKERITVPAGTFDTWRLEIRGSDRRQIAWYADTPLRPLVQYDNSVQLFRLLSVP
jgi:hypothetical protein